MAKPEWGAKRICQSCSAPFYDLRRDSIICPKCGARFDPEAVLKSRRTRGADEAVAEKPKPKAEVAEVTPDAGDKDAADDEGELPEDAIDAVDAVDDDDDDEVLEDASDLGDDDVSDVIDTSKDKEDT